MSSKIETPNTVKKASTLSYVSAFLSIFAFVAITTIFAENTFKLNSLTPYSSLLLEGYLNTILVSVIALIGSILFGFLLYLMSINSKRSYARALSDLLTEIIYGTPMLVLIFVMAFVVGPAYGSLNRPLWGVAAIILYMSPYMMNVLKAAISSIPEEQYMAMELFGFSKRQKYRYLIIPQVIKVLMPPLMNNFSLIIKGSALLNVISYNEIFYAVRISSSKTGAYTEGYILMWLLYLTITIPLSQFTKHLEKRLSE